MRVSTGNTVVRLIDYFRVFGTVDPELDNGLMIFGGVSSNFDFVKVDRISKI
jgi:hypothetical protein